MASSPPTIPRTIADVLRAADPDAPALVTRSGRYSYAELDRLANQAAHALAALGVRGGDRVAASLPNDTDVVVAFHGTMRIGAIWVGINRALAPPEKQYQLSDSGASLLLCDVDTAAQIGASVHHVEVGAGGEWDDLMEAAPDATFRADIDPFAPAGIAYTSGTTGHPKGAVHSQHNLLVPGAVIVASRGYGATLRKGDCFPLTVLNMQVLTTLLVGQAGGCSVIMDRIDAAGVAEWIRREQVTTWNGPPPLLHTMAYSDDIASEDLASLEEVWTGGADCPEALRDAFEAKFGLPVVATYGLSEAPTVVSIDGLAREHVAGASGRALPHLDVHIEDGEVCVRAVTDGPWSRAYRPMIGYWGRPDATATAVVDGVLHTGDLGDIDAEGFLHIRDRKNLVILRGGANVYPAEVERVVNAVPGVAASAVLGVADERLGERVVAVIEPAPGAVVDLDVVARHCAANLAKYKVPERFAVVEALPRNSMGKVRRRELEDLF
ncbi:MAG: class I adenylate-forming enzyme family protein [Acidimicrobiales bacterium]